MRKITILLKWFCYIYPPYSLSPVCRALYCVHFFSNKESELLFAAMAKNPRRLMLGTLTHERECR